MIFGRVKLEQARGGILAHSLKTSEGVLRKGALVDDHAYGLLQEAGYKMLTIARLEPGDVPEGEAACGLSDLLVSPGLRRSTDVNGRVNLFATADGLLRIDTDIVTGLNLVDESIALATLPDYSVVKKDNMVATLKIIPFAVSGHAMSQVENLLGQSKQALALKPFQPLQVGLVITRLPQLKDATIANTIQATQARIAAHGGTLLPPLDIPHDSARIAASILQLLEEGADMILISGASAVTDRLDTAPAGIVLAGGEISHFGMPVDPGNLICFGSVAGKPALVLPGCARSPALNGIDWVLDRIFSGEHLNEAAIAAMGAGGLLKETKSRPAPRAQKTASGIGKAPPAPLRFAALVLAAGKSSRMGSINKLLAPMPDGRSMIAHTVDNVLASIARPVIVVTGHQDRDIRNALAGKPVRFLHAADYAQGLSASLQAGISAISAEIGGVIICLGDMPLIGPEILGKLLAAYSPELWREIIIPTFDGQRGNPVLWGKRFFPEFLKLSGDTGARQIMHFFADFITEVPVDSDAILRDFDTPEMLASLTAPVTV